MLKALHPYLWRHRAALLLGVLMVLITNSIILWVPILVGWVVNLAERRQVDSESLFLLALGIVCVAALSGCFRFLMRRILIDVSRDIEFEMRNDMFSNLQRLDPTYFDGNNTGDLMSRATNDMDAVRMLIGPGIMYSANTIFSLPMTLVGMLVLDWKLTLVAMLPMFGLPALVKYFGQSTHHWSKEQQDSFGALSTLVQEHLAGIRVVKAYRMEASELTRFHAANDDYIAKSLKLAWLQSIFFPSIRVLVGLGYVFLLGFGGWQITAGELRVGTLMTFLMLFSMIVWPLIAAGWVVNLIQRGIASLGRVAKVLDARPLVHDAPAQDGTAVVREAPVAIELRNLTFQYPGTPKAQLQDVSLTIPPGGTLGIVGPVGSGKTTLVNLLLRFYPVERGMIFIGGRDINDWNIEELRRKVAYVFQETFLFSDTIGWNIRFGTAEDAPQSAVEGAARVAHVHADIANFPKKYDTMLGERGVNLSGGQKQRVSIARALLRHSPILLLDDCLSAVDTHTEEEILSHLREEMKGRSTILISHRISTVALASEIVVLEEGRITQRGRHDDLIEQPGLYGELYRRQLSEAEVETFGEA